MHRVQGSWKTHVLSEFLDQFADSHDKLAAPTTLPQQPVEGKGNCKRTVYSLQMTNNEDEILGECGEHFYL